jgi:hypothetical protein
MKNQEFMGVLIEEPEYVSGVSSNGFSWNKINLVLREDGGDFEFCFSKFGNKSIQINDMGLHIGDRLLILYMIECKKGSGVYDGKYFTNLLIEDIEYLGKDNSISGIKESEYKHSVSGGIKLDTDIFPDIPDNGEDKDLPF